MELDDIDLLDLDRFMEGAPHEELAVLREYAPVWRHPEKEGPGFWVISKHADVVACSRDYQTFSSAAEHGGVVGMGEQTAEEKALVALEGEVMLYMDPPKHTRYRKLVSNAFTPQVTGLMDHKIRGIARSIVDDIVAKKKIDFVTDVANKLPLEVICEIMGVPRSDRHLIAEWTGRMSALDDADSSVSSGTAMEARMELYLYVSELRNQKRQSPGEDLFSALLAGADESLSDLEIDIFFLLLVSAGNETTRNAISGGINALASYPDEWERLKRNPSLVPLAVDEILRWTTPVMYFRRNVLKDVKIRGVQMEAGDKVALWYLSANRDEEVFEDSFKFDIARQSNRHISFGGGGPHYCIGASLAKLELRAIMEEIVARIASFEVVGDVGRLRSNFLNAITSLPVSIRS